MTEWSDAADGADEDKDEVEDKVEAEAEEKAMAGDGERYLGPRFNLGGLVRSKLLCLWW